jgi:hypothetical protein
VNLTAWLTTPIISQASYASSPIYRTPAQNKKADRLLKDNRPISNCFSATLEALISLDMLGISQTSLRWE